MVFTSGATASLKMVGEMFPWRPGATFAHARASHNSVLGVREYASKGGADIECVDLNTHWGLQEDGGVRPRDSRCRCACGGGGGWSKDGRNRTVDLRGKNKLGRVADIGGDTGKNNGADGEACRLRRGQVEEEAGGDVGGIGDHGCGGDGWGSVGVGGGKVDRPGDDEGLVKQRGALFGGIGGGVGDVTAPASADTDTDADTNTDHATVSADIESSDADIDSSDGDVDGTDAVVDSNGADVDSSDEDIDSSDGGIDDTDGVVDCLFAFPAECNATGARPDLAIAGRVKRGALSMPPCTCPPRGSHHASRRRVAGTAANGNSSGVVEGGRRASARVNPSGATDPEKVESCVGDGPAASGGAIPPPPPAAAATTGRRPRKRWWVMLDAAKFVGTAPLDLSAVEADYVTLSFYKIFG